MTERQAGQFAEERFRQRKRAWLRRIWWLRPLAVIFYVLLFVAMGLVVGGPMPFFWDSGSARISHR